MTAKTEVYLKDFNDNQPDQLIATLEIELTFEQKLYLRLNDHDKRTLLLKKFNLQFGTSFTKMQLTRAIEVMKAPLIKPTGKRKNRNYKTNSKNVYWITRRQRWLVQFRTTDGIKSLGYFKEYEDARNAAEHYRKNSA